MAAACRAHPALTDELRAVYVQHMADQQRDRDREASFSAQVATRQELEQRPTAQQWSVHAPPAAAPCSAPTSLRTTSMLPEGLAAPVGAGAWQQGEAAECAPLATSPTAPCSEAVLAQHIVDEMMRRVGSGAVRSPPAPASPAGHTTPAADDPGSHAAAQPGWNELQHACLDVITGALQSGLLRESDLAGMGVPKPQAVQPPSPDVPKWAVRGQRRKRCRARRVFRPDEVAAARIAAACGVQEAMALPAPAAHDAAAVSLPGGVLRGLDAPHSEVPTAWQIGVTRYPTAWVYRLRWLTTFTRDLANVLS